MCLFCIGFQHQFNTECTCNSGSAGASPSRPEDGPWEGEAPADPTHRVSDARANFFSMGIMDLSRT